MTTTPNPLGPNAIPIMRSDEVHLEDLPWRFPTRSPLTHQAEIRQIASCVARGLKRLTLQKLQPGVLSVVGFGPTLRETWQGIKHPMITTSGAHDFLLDRGIVPDFHAQMDGRDHQAKFLTRPHKDTAYVMASICCPAVFDQLEGHRVYYWHCAHGKHVVDWIGEHDDGAILVAGGTHIGVTAVHLGGILGYRRFRLFGIDGHRDEAGARHAGKHHDPNPQRSIRRFAGGRWWSTSPQMSNGADEVTRLSDEPSIELSIMGDSLQSALLREKAESDAVWRGVLMAQKDEWVTEVSTQHAAAEALRPRADYNTGSITESASLVLRCLAAKYQPRVVAEVGTFIGNSAAALSSCGATVYTCDRSNDCLQATERVRTHPRQDATTMLGAMRDAGLRADMFFFDGRLTDHDVPLVLGMSRRSTVYVFDDYEGAQKGVTNVELLRPFLPTYRLITPPRGFKERVALAMLVPGEER